ncbi:MAG: hypothetical protein FWG62_08735, partial [Proteobacteria bacterium]|nr:hypothetical protein [Pseudomonadota bacterium]
MSKTVRCLLLITTLVALAGCGVKNTVQQWIGLGGPESSAYSGPVYPPTQTAGVAFQPAQVGRT